MSESDIRARFESFRDALTPLDSAPHQIQRAVRRRRRRPAVIGSTVTGAAAIALAATLLPGGLGASPPPPASFAPPRHADLAPVEISAETVEDWARSADAVALVSTDGETVTVEMSWRRSPATASSIPELELHDDGPLVLPTVQGTEVSLARHGMYLTALRWEQVRCDGGPPGWVLLGEEAVLPYDDDVVGRPAGGPLELEDPAASAFAGLTASEVAEVLDELAASHDFPRTPGPCR